MFVGSAYWFYVVYWNAVDQGSIPGALVAAAFLLAPWAFGGAVYSHARGRETWECWLLAALAAGGAEVLALFVASFMAFMATGV